MSLVLLFGMYASDAEAGRKSRATQKSARNVLASPLESVGAQPERVDIKPARTETKSKVNRGIAAERIKTGRQVRPTVKTDGQETAL